MSPPNQQEMTDSKRPCFNSCLLIYEAVNGGTVIYVKVSFFFFFFFQRKNIYKINGTRYQNPFLMKRVLKLMENTLSKVVVRLYVKVMFV